MTLQDPSLFGVPVDFLLFGLTLVGVVVFHQCTILPRLFEDLERRREKKGRHRRLSLVLRGLPVTWESRSLGLKKTQRVSAVGKTTPFQRQKLLRASFQA